MNPPCLSLSSSTIHLHLFVFVVVVFTSSSPHLTLPHLNSPLPLRLCLDFSNSQHILPVSCSFHLITALMLLSTLQSLLCVCDLSFGAPKLLYNPSVHVFSVCSGWLLGLLDCCSLCKPSNSILKQKLPLFFPFFWNILELISSEAIPNVHWPCLIKNSCSLRYLFIS